MLIQYGNVLFDDETGDVDYIESHEEFSDERNAGDVHERLGETQDEHDYWEQLAEEEDAETDRLIEEYGAEYFK